jgi:Initiator Rep protein, WH2/Initiator Replication protein, WH1
MNTSLTFKQQSNYDGFPKAAELIEIEGAHALEASDRAMFNQLLQTAHDSGRLTEPDVEWEISLAGLRRASTKHESNDRIRDSLRRLRRTEVRVTYVSARTGLSRTMETHLLEFTDTDDADSPAATVQFGIPKRLRAVLARSNRWGRIRCEISYAMTSKYAIALYEMVCLRANLDRCVETIDIAKFRELLGVPPGAYDRADNFMRNVIAPAVLEVNGLSDIGVEIEMVRKHPRAPAHAVAITWWRKQGDQFRDAMQERSRPKFGRMARLKGQVEPLAADYVAQVNAEVAEKLEKMRAEERAKLAAAE